MCMFIIVDLLLDFEDAEALPVEADVKPLVLMPPKKKKTDSTKSPVGRRLEDVWKDFEVTLLGPGKKMTVCRHCSKKTSDGARAYRLREHLMKCEKYLECFGSGSSTSVPAKSMKATVKKGSN